MSPECCTNLPGPIYLVTSGVLADKDEEDEAAPEKVDTSDDPEEELCRGETLHVPMISMDKIVNTFKYPQDAHYSEQLAVQQLKTKTEYFLSIA